MKSDTRLTWTFVLTIFMAIGATAFYLLTNLSTLPLWLQALYLIIMMVCTLIVAVIIMGVIETLLDNRWRKQNKLKKVKEEQEHRNTLYRNLPEDMSFEGRAALTDRIILDEQKKKQINIITSSRDRQYATIAAAQKAVRELDATLRELAPDMFPESQEEDMKSPVEKKFIPKNDTHFVLKKDHARTWLTPTQYTQLSNLIRRVHMKRLNKGMSIPEYWVINKDEPYSYKIEDVIQEGETKK